MVVYNGKTLTPAIRSITGATAGWFKMGPITGKDLKNCTIILKKSPNKFKIPNNSTINPVNVHLKKSINTIPVKKHNEPLLLDGLLKKTRVLFGPMISTRPMINRIFPKASKALSKNVKIPKVKNKKPPNVNATPNFCASDSQIILY